MVGKIGGQYTEIKAIALKIDIKDWFQIKVIAKDGTFEGYYGRKLISEIKDKDLRERIRSVRGAAAGPLISMTLM